MQTLDQIQQTSTTAIWVGRVMSGLVIVFLLLDAGMKLILLDR